MVLRVLSVLVLLVAGSLLAGCLGDADFEEHVPVWEPGFTWTYEQVARALVTGTMETPDGSDSESAEVEMLLTSRYEVLNADATVDGEPAYLVAVEVELLEARIDGAQVWPPGTTAADDAETQALLNETCAAACRSFAWFTIADLAITNDPTAQPQPSLDFPLTKGKTWQVGGVEVNDQEAVLNAEAVRVEDRTLNGAQTRAVRIETTMHPDFARKIRQQIEADSNDEAKITASVSAHGTDHYVPAARNLASSGIAVDLRLRIDTDDVTLDSRVLTTATGELVDHVLDPKPPRTMEQYLTGPQPVPLPPADPWPFAITASAGSVDAATGEEITFAVDTATSRLEPGATIRWTHSYFDAEGPQAVRAKGDGYAATITDPGRHGVVATVHDAEGRLRGTAVAYVDAFTRVALATDSVVGAAVLPGDAPTVGFFVAPGWTNMTVTAAPSGLAIGTLEIGPTDGTAHSIDVTPLEDTWDVPATGEYGPYNLTWTDTARVLDAAFTVEVHYGPREGEATAAALAKGIWALREAGLLGQVWRP